jgi:hypothetical protein
MGKATDRFIAVWIVLTLLSINSFPQREVSIPIRKQEGFVLEFKPPYDRMVIDIGTNNFIESETVTLEVPVSSAIVNKKNRPLDRALLRPGTRIEFAGERSANRVLASAVKVLTDLEKWEVELKGYFESLDGDRAWVDGQAVKLPPGVIIRGDDKWTGQSFTSFNDVQAGAEMKIEGVRRADGIVYARSVTVEPNDFTNNDRNLKLLVEKGLVMPSSLAGGKGMVAGREVKFANDLDLQTYVTKIGKRLVPRYQKDLPADYPGKLVYRFAVIEDETFNAFALPDGSIFVHTGLLRQIRNEAQLATILGHEIAHVTHEHGRKQLQDAQNKQWLVLGAAVGGRLLGSNEAAVAGIIAVGALQNKYGRDKEDQADRVGLYYMTQAGYDPREGPKIWREVSNNTRVDAVSNFLYSDHSSARERLKHMNREIAYNYYDTDFSKTKIGANEYMDVVGVYFGWKPRPVVPVPTAVSKPTGKPAPRRTGKSRTAPAAPKPTVPVWQQTGTFATFFAQFRQAVLKNERTAVRNTVSPTFEWALDGKVSNDEAWRLFTREARHWQDLRRSVLRPPYACQSTWTSLSGFCISSGPRAKYDLMFANVGGYWRFYALRGD